MIDIRELLRWLGTLDPNGSVAVDDGGLALVELDSAREQTGAMLEVGGISDDDDEYPDEPVDCDACGRPIDDPFASPGGLCGDCEPDD